MDNNRTDYSVIQKKAKTKKIHAVNIIRAVIQIISFIIARTFYQHIFIFRSYIYFDNTRYFQYFRAVLAYRSCISRFYHHFHLGQIFLRIYMLIRSNARPFMVWRQAYAEKNQSIPKSR